MTFISSFFRPCSACLITLAVLLGPPSQAHEFKQGALVIEHPYATPSPQGATSGAAYIRAIKNTGDTPDRLIGAQTTAAESVEIHRMVMDGDVMRMRQVDAVDLPAGQTVSLRHGGEWHLMLIKLKNPLKEGDRLTLTLRFAHAGARDVTVVVQQPKTGDMQHRH